MMQMSLLNRLRGQKSTSALPLPVIDLGMNIPNVPLDYELIEWEVLDSCLVRQKYLVDNFNCYYHSKEIKDMESCFAHGKFCS